MNPYCICSILTGTHLGQELSLFTIPPLHSTVLEPDFHLKMQLITFQSWLWNMTAEDQNLGKFSTLNSRCAVAGPWGCRDEFIPRESQWRCDYTQIKPRVNQPNAGAEKKDLEKFKRLVTNTISRTAQQSHLGRRKNLPGSFMLQKTVKNMVQFKKNQ